MTTDHQRDHDPIDPQDHEFDARVAGRLRRATADLHLPTTTAAQAEADGRQRQRRTRLMAGTGVVATVVAAVAVVLAIQPLGSADVVEAPVRSGSGESCPETPTGESTEPAGLPEARLESTGITGWALLFADAPPWPVGEPIRITWRLSGNGEPEAAAIATSGIRVGPEVMQPIGSNWDRPGDEFETVFVFDEPGCWRLRMAREGGSASLTVRVVDPLPLGTIELTVDQLRGRITRATAAAADAPADSIVHQALAADDLVTEDELDTAVAFARRCTRDAGATANIALGDHFGDVTSTSTGSDAAVQRCMDRHVTPTLSAFLTLFEPTAQQRASVPDCGGENHTACLDDAESVVDEIILTNIRRAKEILDDAGPDHPEAGSAAEEPGLETTIDLDCSTVIESVAAPEEPFGQVLDAVALPIAPSATEALYARREDVDPERPWFAKSGLLVRADTDVTITVDDADTTAIRWGNGAREFFGPSLATDGCPGEGWLAFPGGFRVDEPRCVTLHVATPDGEQVVEVGVGAPCAGQRPPRG